MRHRGGHAGERVPALSPGLWGPSEPAVCTLSPLPRLRPLRAGVGPVPIPQDTKGSPPPPAVRVQGPQDSSPSEGSKPTVPGRGGEAQGVQLAGPSGPSSPYGSQCRPPGTGNQGFLPPGGLDAQQPALPLAWRQDGRSRGSPGPNSPPHAGIWRSSPRAPVSPPLQVTKSPPSTCPNPVTPDSHVPFPLTGT